MNVHLEGKKGKDNEILMEKSGEGGGGEGEEAVEETVGLDNHREAG